MIFCYDFIEYRLIDSKHNKEFHFRFIDSIILSMLICCKNDLMKLKNENDTKFMKLLIHYPDTIKIEQIIKEALKIDSIINKENNFDFNKLDLKLSYSFINSE